MAVFWKLALGYEDEPAPAPFPSPEAWLASYGIPESEWGQGAWLHDPAGIGPRLSILTVPEPKVAKTGCTWTCESPASDRRRSGGAASPARPPS